MVTHLVFYVGWPSVTVAIAFIRGSIFAALITKFPLPQVPRTPIRSTSTDVLRSQEVHGRALESSA